MKNTLLIASVLLMPLPAIADIVDLTLPGGRIDWSVMTKGLPIVDKEKDTPRTGEKFIRGAIKTKDSAVAGIEVIGDDLKRANRVNFRCNEFVAGKVVPWRERGGICYPLLIKVLGNAVDQPEIMAVYLTRESGVFKQMGMIPTRTAKSNLGAFEISLGNDGFFSLRH